jgi:transcriptional regulator with XRE-family HTH domain
MTEFKHRLKELRESRRLNKTQLAEVVGITRQLISAYEKGTSVPNMTVFVIIADYFGVSADYLLGRNASRDRKSVV